LGDLVEPQMRELLQQSWVEQYVFRSPKTHNVAPFTLDEACLQVMLTMTENFLIGYARLPHSIHKLLTYHMTPAP
jgi:hypothetical protein